MTLLETEKLSLPELIHQASLVHKEHHEPGLIKLCTALSIKTGGCPEDCAYCPHSAHYSTGIEKKSIMTVDEVRQFAQKNRQLGSLKLCLGGAWRSVPNGKEFDRILEIVAAVKQENLIVCCNMGMITLEQAKSLKAAGCDEYNHNLDSSRRYYEKIISTRTYDDRLQSLQNIRNAGLKVSSGGIIGMEESITDRIELIQELASLNPQPEVIILNKLHRIPGTPLEHTKDLNSFDFIRVVAWARLTMPKAEIALAAARKSLSHETQMACFQAGVNAIYTGAKILTVENPTHEEDLTMLRHMNLRIQS